MSEEELEAKVAQFKKALLSGDEIDDEELKKLKTEVLKAIAEKLANDPDLIKKLKEASAELEDEDKEQDVQNKVRATRK